MELEEGENMKRNEKRALTEKEMVLLHLPPYHQLEQTWTVCNIKIQKVVKQTSPHNFKTMLFIATINHGIYETSFSSISKRRFWKHLRDEVMLV
jgi:hypothetical protein